MIWTIRFVLGVDFHQGGLMVTNEVNNYKLGLWFHFIYIYKKKLGEVVF